MFSYLSATIQWAGTKELKYVAANCNSYVTPFFLLLIKFQIEFLTRPISNTCCWDLSDPPEGLCRLSGDVKPANSPETLTHSWRYCVAGSLANLLPAPPAAGKGTGACDYDLLPHLGSTAACVPTSARTSNWVSDLPAVSQAPVGPGW